MKKKLLTIHDIADRLGVSKSTVSRAFRDAHDISPKTKKRIMDFARENDFTPDQTAVNFKSGKTKTIGVIVPAHNIPFYAIAISGIQDYAMEKEYHVMVCHSNENYETEVDNLKALLSAKVDGIIISLARDNLENTHIKRLKQKKIPFVLFNRVVEGLKANKVVVNDYYGAKQMVEYLVDRGCTKIAHVAGPSNILLSANRTAGYRDALKEKHLTHYDDWVIEGDFSVESGMRAAEKLLSKDTIPDAIFCVCDAVAYGVMKVLNDRGIKIPEDVSVAGFTNEPMSEFVSPPLTTVGQPIYKIGQKAAALLFQQLESKETADEFCVLETELVIRKSTR